MLVAACLALCAPADAPAGFDDDVGALARVPLSTLPGLFEGDVIGGPVGREALSACGEENASRLSFRGMSTISGNKIPSLTLLLYY